MSEWGEGPDDPRNLPGEGWWAVLAALAAWAFVFWYAAVLVGLLK